MGPGVGNDKSSSRHSQQKGLPNINSKGKMSNLYKKLLSVGMWQWGGSSHMEVGRRGPCLWENIEN